MSIQKPNIFRYAELTGYVSAFGNLHNR